MAVLDWVLVALLLASIALGAWRGLVFEVLSLLGWIAAFVLAQWFAPEVAARLPIGEASETVRYAAGFVIVFIVAAFAAGLLTALVRKLVQVVGLRPVDRVLGMFFGALRGVVFLLAGTVVVYLVSLDTQPWWQESRGALLLTDLLHQLRPMLPEEFAKFLP
ncbi:CvpA family protein [Variovorax sp. HJSM1_2]|uniref:CvpA family protein n=1 Tax=Variovorax sp. HJSM1_2 TaxID=3366263 RepID=UPI003BD480BE